jgi:hypothetical protein
VAIDGAGSVQILATGVAEPRVMQILFAAAGTDDRVSRGRFSKAFFDGFKGFFQFVGHRGQRSLNFFFPFPRIGDACFHAFTRSRAAFKAEIRVFGEAFSTLRTKHPRSPYNRERMNDLNFSAKTVILSHVLKKVGAS